MLEKPKSGYNLIELSKNKEEFNYEKIKEKN